MRETEITVQVFNSEQEIKEKLLGLGFRVVRRVTMSDWYFSKYSTEELLKMDYSQIMRNSFLVRKFAGDTNKILLHYKDKEIDDSGNVLSEEKLTEMLTDESIAIKIFKSAKLNNWCEIVQDMTIYNGNGMEFAVQAVDGQGIYIEYEEDASMAGLEPQQKIEAMVAKLKSFGLILGFDYSVKKVYTKFLKECGREHIQ